MGKKGKGKGKASPLDLGKVKEKKSGERIFHCM